MNSQALETLNHMNAELRAAGFNVTGVDDGGELVPCTTWPEALAAVESVDYSQIHYASAAGRGVVVVIPENGADVVSDYSTASAEFCAAIERAQDNA